jgi:hypothetical protein
MLIHSLHKNKPSKTAFTSETFAPPITNFEFKIKKKTVIQDAFLYTGHISILMTEFYANH